MVWKVGGGTDDKRVAECWQLMEMGDGYIEFIILLFTFSLFEIFYNKSLNIKNKLETNLEVSLIFVFKFLKNSYNQVSDHFLHSLLLYLLLIQ